MKVLCFMKNSNSWFDRPTKKVINGTLNDTLPHYGKKKGRWQNVQVIVCKGKLIDTDDDNKDRGIPLYDWIIFFVVV